MKTNMLDSICVMACDDEFQLIREFEYHSKCGIVVTVPVDFVTDFASVPPIFYSLVPPIGDTNIATLVHDFLYSTQCPIDLSRKKADEIFLEIMVDRGVSKIKRNLMYRAVRVFGGPYWRKSGKSCLPKCIRASKCSD